MPARRVVANLNLDMIGREEEIPDPSDPRYQGFARTTASQNTNVVHLLGYSLLTRSRGSRPERERHHRPDDQGRLRPRLAEPAAPIRQLAVPQHGIPAVFLTTGLHPDYHSPTTIPTALILPSSNASRELACRAAWMTADGDAPRLKSK